MSGVWTAVCLIFLTPLTSHLPRGFPFPFFHLNEVILMALFGLFALQHLVAEPERRKALFRVSWLDALFALLFLTGTIIPLLGYLFTTKTIVTASAVRYLDLVQFYMLYRILITTVDHENKMLMCILALLTAGMVIAIIGILEACNISPVRQLIQTYYPSYNLERNIEIGYPRIVSLMGAPQTYAAFLAIQLFICLTLLIDSAANVPSRFVGLVLFVCFLGFVPSGGYSAMIGALFMFLLLLWFHRRLPRWVWVLGSISLVVGAVIFAPFILARLKFQFQLPGEFIPYTLQARFQHWTLAIEALRPLDWLAGSRGVQPQNLFSFENQYIHFLYRGGLLLVGAFVYFILRVILESYRTFQQADGLIKPVALCTLIVLIGFSVMGITDSYFTNSGVSEAIWTLISLTATRDSLNRQNIPPMAGTPLIQQSLRSV